MTRKQGNCVYDLLVEQAGAPEDLREDFLYWLATDAQPRNYAEFRFQGKLGFGGKFWLTGDGMYVTCYWEDVTPEREKILKTVDDSLAALEKEWGIYR
jgi:hypothetical protein